ncbi:hypothetical protein [Alcanivorax sp. 1008]|uniref:hypothetical protein n=1 Tax=Alcanivorax sp. 1008 TaxID=2816853 RepID=UPI001D98ED13|nr:hypothetical protein [Alcanivorax sp. 1008]MCC1496678.1 hypothetical protein [Alcanivorax sp. 1008]
MERIWIQQIVVALLCTALAGISLAGPREQAKQLHDRLTGTPAAEPLLIELAALIEDDREYDAAMRAMQEDAFYDITLKNFVMPWTNEQQNVFAPLNDYVATVIGMARDGIDFREVLSGDILYAGDSTALNNDGYSVPAVSASSNAHYEALENQRVPLQDYLIQQQQSAIYGIPANATAGVITSRASSMAYFVAGTNRAMLRFTLMHHLCRDMEQMHDISRPADRIRQDVTRSPGGDSRVFLNNCVGCHNGMDPMAQAFAYYNWTGEEGTGNGQLEYTDDSVQPKYLINSNNFPYGFVTPDDRWDNYWRSGPHSGLGWSASLTGNGNGAKSLGEELANSEAFATCQAQKTFRAVCLRGPTSATDVSQIESMTSNFRNNGYQLKDLFADAAVYCMGE